MGLGEMGLGELGLGEMGLGEMGQNPLQLSDSGNLTLLYTRWFRVFYTADIVYLVVSIRPTII